MIAYFLSGGKLPWSGKGTHEMTEKEHYKIIWDIKEKTSSEDLANGHPEEFLELFKYIKTL